MSESETINVPASSARAFEVRSGSLVKIVDIEGQQVGDFVAFMLPDLKEKFSAGRTRIENSTLRISIGNRLLSNVCNLMFTIMEDTCRVTIYFIHPVPDGFSSIGTRSNRMTAAWRT
jgi:uncharacterized protein YcgI (DUF1989 family)